MDVPDRLTGLQLDDFVDIAIERGLATAGELEQFAMSWRRGYDAGDPGFGDETDLDDWTGGLEAWRALRVIAEAFQRAER